MGSRYLGAAFAACLSGVVVILGALPTWAAPSKPSAEPSPSASAAQEQVLLPSGTIVIVKTRHGINSYGEEAGAKVTYEVAQDVVLNGYVFAKAGDIAEGTIDNAQEGKNDLFDYKAANLRLTVDTIYNFCGDKIDADFTRSEYRRRQGFLGSHKDVEIIKGQMYQVSTEHPQKVCAERTTEKASPIPSDALPGDKN
jgi:hypothetical protein